uniref:Uncharacterized protein n=1 Tax=Romanomermis culicivorax TaxID=13658 RepID=A0A915IKH8_ROMCU
MLEHIRAPKSPTSVLVVGQISHKVQQLSLKKTCSYNTNKIYLHIALGYPELPVYSKYPGNLKTGYPGSKIFKASKNRKDDATKAYGKFSTYKSVDEYYDKLPIDGRGKMVRHILELHYTQTYLINIKISLFNVELECKQDKISHML